MPEGSVKGWIISSVFPDGAVTVGVGEVIRPIGGGVDTGELKKDSEWILLLWVCIVAGLIGGSELPIEGEEGSSGA